ncbi:glycosyltransferase [Castellaniella sp. WN]
MELDDIYLSGRRPYYVYAPPYRRISSGVQVLHLLCHYLNRMGEEAYVCTDGVFPKLRTPVLTEDIVKKHQEIGIEPIAVYPEVTHGNPLHAKCVVRYILNHLGLLGGPSDFAESDFLVFYDKEYLSRGFSEAGSLVLTTPVLDFNLFNNKENPLDACRKGALVYPGRYFTAREKHEKLFETSTVITSEWPSSREELAALLRGAEVLYCFANSAIIGEAALCGCPVVMMDSPFTKRPETFHDKENIDGRLDFPGRALDDSEESLQNARKETKGFQDLYLGIHKEFIVNLKKFIIATQEITPVESQDAGPYSISFQITSAKDPEADSWGFPQWMSERTPSSARTLALKTLLETSSGVGSLGAVVIMPDDADVQALIDTLESLGIQHRPVDGVWLIGRNVPVQAAGGEIELLSGDAHWAKLLSDRINQGGIPDFLWILHAGDRLVPHATLTMGEYRLRKPDPLIWYVDEAVLKDGQPVNPMFKPDLNVDLLRSYPYIGRNLVISTAAVQAAGGLDERVADLAPVDLLWRLVEQVGPPVVGHIPEVLQFGGRSLMDWVCDSDTMLWFPAVTQAHFVRMGLEAKVESGPLLGLQHIEYPLTMQPLISIIIPTRDQLPILRACIEGLMERTAYLHYELLVVDNGSADPDAVAFLAGLEAMETDQIHVVRWPQSFDFAAMNNFAVTRARGDVFLFLNNDIQFGERTRSDWLERLLRHALRPEVGMVGSRLDIPDGGVEQCGQVLGMDNSVGAAFRGVPEDRRGYMNRLIVQQNVSALSASCMMMRRQVFDELGGFDAESFPIYYADADLCMKAIQVGYLLVLEPDTGLLHMGGASRALTEKFGLQANPDDEQRDRLYQRWLQQLARDPNYHPAFGKYSPGFTLSRDASRIQEPLPGRPLPVVLAVHGDWYGCGHYRILHPFRAMAGELRLDGGLKYGDFHFTDVARIQPDVIVLQGAWRNEGILTQIRRYREITGAKVVLEFDDYLPNLPTRNIHRSDLPQGLIKKMRRTIEQVDWLVVSTPTLAREYADFHDDIRVALNGLPLKPWGGLQGQRRTKKKMRIGWAGGISHTGDLAEIRSVVKDLQDEVEWVFMGMKPDDVVCEFHPGFPIDQYPAQLAALNLDLAVVPLEMNQFNRCKSNLRLLELGACGVPIICTDIDPYQCGLPVTRVRNRTQDWVRAIREHLADSEALGQKGDALRDAVRQNWMLEGDFLDQWARAWGVASGAA